MILLLMISRLECRERDRSCYSISKIPFAAEVALEVKASAALLPGAKEVRVPAEVMHKTRLSPSSTCSRDFLILNFILIMAQPLPRFLHSTTRDSSAHRLEPIPDLDTLTNPPVKFRT